MKKIDTLGINSIRVLSIEAIEKANSGHPGLPLGAAPMAYELWLNHMKHNPNNPKWINRDRFVLSAGHGSMLLYSLLHLFDYGVTIEDIKNFRQLGSKTPGHPEYGHTVGVETTTGPLGAGFATSVGMAMAEANLATKFNVDGYNIIDHYTYTIVGDGCLMEGISSEAASLAGTLKLGKLIALYDSNNITIEGNTEIAFTENVAKRFEAYDWQVIEVNDGNDIVEIGNAIEQAKNENNKPSLIIVKTQIGYGCPKKQGKSSAHGEPLGKDNIVETKENLGWEYKEEFFVPQEVYSNIKEKISLLKEENQKWDDLFEEYQLNNKELAEEFKIWFDDKIEYDLLGDKEFINISEKPNATRAFSGDIIQSLSKYIPNLIGGSADLAPSNKTYMKEKDSFSKDNYSGMNIHYGVRELAMAAIGNGICLHGGLKTFVSTFFVFSDYLKPMLRLSALMKLPLTYVLTHDSIGVGEDGPTHQPIEQLAALRSIPNTVTFRPADGKETLAAWHYAINSKEVPTALVLTRQNVPYYAETGKDALKGGYIIIDSENEVPELILMASGSELEYVYNAGKKLIEEGIDVRVVSIPSMELFDLQGKEYKEKILPMDTRKRVAIEAATDFGWHKYVGLDGEVISINSFGASAPGEELFKEFGITTEKVYQVAKELIK